MTPQQQSELEKAIVYAEQTGTSVIVLRAAKSHLQHLQQPPVSNEDTERLVDFIAIAASGWLLSDRDLREFDNDPKDKEGLKCKIRQAIDKARGKE